MAKRAREVETVKLGDVQYAVHERVLLATLADGTPGPAVGHIDRAGGIIIDEHSAAGEWVGELLTARLPSRDHDARGEHPAIPAHLEQNIADGRAAEWRNAIDSDEVAACRVELAQLESEGALRRGNHGQATSTRGDRITFLTLDPDGTNDGDLDDGCPPALRRTFAQLELVGAHLEKALGCGTLLTPRLGMAAVYDGRYGYVRHLDNERVPMSDGAGAGDDDDAICTAARAASEFRNFRVLTAICYLNDSDWNAADGGQLRCYDGETCTLEVEPRGGTIVVFPSCVIPHEVLPSTRPRYAVTLWFVSSSLLRGSPSERAKRANAARTALRLRRATAKAAKPSTTAVEGSDLSQSSGSAAAAAPPLVATPTAAAAAAWADEAESKDGGGFSFGF